MQEIYDYWIKQFKSCREKYCLNTLSFNIIFNKEKFQQYFIYILETHLRLSFRSEKYFNQRKMLFFVLI